ncbi:hypothetical protein SAMN06296065_11662 [Novosphingobium panipatense]|uniref:Uncharacterized protein n=1 Tax=Novosphingobium panipatense TaxID=428991 RepID=A0ABY1QV06_9SPHN|nr:hypothetical protein SAMN06296065_11662 [Novosphingobium panipatense]
MLAGGLYAHANGWGKRDGKFNARHPKAAPIPRHAVDSDAYRETGCIGAIKGCEQRVECRRIDMCRVRNRISSGARIVQRWEPRLMPIVLGCIIVAWAGPPADDRTVAADS